MIRIQPNLKTRKERIGTTTKPPILSIEKGGSRSPLFCGHMARMFGREPFIFASRRTAWALALILTVLSLVILAEKIVAFGQEGFGGGGWGAVLEWGELTLATMGIIATVRFIAHLRAQNQDLQARLDRLAGPFPKALEQQFQAWALSEAEADVALFMVKGLSLREIAELRGTSEGTVKFQANAVYKKAGVSGRGQLLSQLIEDHLP